MGDMMKNQKIERKFKRYFDGAPEPTVDLTEAKAELLKKARRREKVRRGLRWQIPAFAAVLLLAVILGFNFLPSLFIKHYSIAEATCETLSYSELKEDYGEFDGYLSGLNKFALSDNSSVDYTLYSVDGKAVLLGADVRYLGGLTMFRASVLVDVSDRKYVADEFAKYDNFEKSRDGYFYQYGYINGEYVFRAYSERNDTRYYVDFTSRNDKAFYDFMKKLLP